MKRLIFAVLIGLSFVVASTTLAQSGGGYDLTWSTIDGGGGTSVGSGSPTPYTLVGTIGQSDAGVVMTGDGLTLAGGFWIGINIVTANYRVFLPVILR